MLGADVKETSLIELSGGGLTSEPAKGSEAAAAPAAAPSAGSGIPMEEVAKHNNKSSCWVILHGRVLDVTDFLKDHPGGELAILTFAGKDATEEFDMIHPKDVIEKYAPNAIIGMVGGATRDIEGGAVGTMAQNQKIPLWTAEKKKQAVFGFILLVEILMCIFVKELSPH